MFEAGDRFPISRSSLVCCRRGYTLIVLCRLLLKDSGVSETSHSFIRLILYTCL